ncbi:Panacea domain-containing protein [Pseudomonas capsici]|uniref:Panacea domain-containing protein n=1 Tax=Pseudomonas capsici TaxID=2810614 RepID=UPI0021F22868|nr:Panacea domain-containing protein [Pseudomonas capsici]MCV4291005.1 Panacea domain-containing protein [Pseudomonas capsici]
MQEVFSPDVAVDVMLYVSTRLKNPTIHEVLKIQYFADKLHLSRYGFMPSGDTYVAMEFGPVGTKTYDLIKAARGERNRFIPASFVTATADHIQVNGADVVVLGEPDLSKLSEAQIECLDDAISQYGNMDFKKRTDISHDEAWHNGRARATKCMLTQDIVSTLENADEVIAHLNL